MRGQYRVDAVGILVQRVVQVEHRPAGVAEQRVHPLLDQHFDKDLRTVESHGGSSSFSFLAGPRRAADRKKQPLPLIPKRQRLPKALCGTTLIGTHASPPQRALHKALHGNGCARTRLLAVFGGSAPGSLRGAPALLPCTTRQFSGGGHAPLLVPFHAFVDLGKTIPHFATIVKFFCGKLAT